MSKNGNKQRIQLLQPYQFELFNRKLKELYGQIDNKPYFRLVWSEDHFEHRIMTHTKDGFQLIQPEVRQVPKYKPWKTDRYVLEGLYAVPVGVETDLVEKVSYEPIWTFEDKDGNYLIPRWDAIHLILETLKQNQEHGPDVKYKDPDSNPKEALDRQAARLEALQKELFGNETSIGDALAHKSGVGYGQGSSPNSNVKEKE